MAAPDLSTTVPEKLALAWPHTLGETQSAAAHIITRKNIFFLIVDTPFQHPKAAASLRRRHEIRGCSCPNASQT